MIIKKFYLFDYFFIRQEILLGLSLVRLTTSQKYMMDYHLVFINKILNFYHFLNYCHSLKTRYKALFLSLQAFPIHFFNLNL